MTRKMKFEVSHSLQNFTGGLLGLAFLGAAGYDGFVVNNEYSVLVSKDHCSVKSFSGKKIGKALIRRIAQYLQYPNYHTEQRDILYIYKD